MEKLVDIVVEQIDFLALAFIEIEDDTNQDDNDGSEWRVLCSNPRSLGSCRVGNDGSFMLVSRSYHGTFGIFQRLISWTFYKFQSWL